MQKEKYYILRNCTRQKITSLFISRVRTCDPLVPNQMRYRAALIAVPKDVYIIYRYFYPSRNNIPIARLLSIFKKKFSNCLNKIQKTCKAVPD